jgi:hypothetical protein
MAWLIGRDAGDFHEGIDHLLGQQFPQDIAIASLAVAVEVTLKTLTQFVVIKRGF